MEAAAKPSTSSVSGVTDGASGRSGTGTAAASMEERFADLCKVRALSCLDARSSPVGWGFCAAAWALGFCFPPSVQGAFFIPW
jgi:hypothetical protein